MKCQFCRQLGTPDNPMYQLACAREYPPDVHFNVQACAKCGGPLIIQAAIKAHRLVCEYRLSPAGLAKKPAQRIPSARWPAQANHRPTTTRSTTGARRRLPT